LLQLARFVFRPLAFLDECAARYGDLFQLDLSGFGRVIIVSDPKAIMEIFAAGPDLVHGGEANLVFKAFLGERSVLLLDGPEHRRQRRMMAPAFHADRIPTYGRTMLALTDASIDAWPLGRPFRLHACLQAITLQVILRTVFGMEEGGRLRRLSELLTEGLDLVASPLLFLPPLRRDLGPWSPWRKVMRIGAEVDAILYGEIARRRPEDHAARTDVLSMLLAARDDDGHGMTDAELRDELLTLLVAGHETSATALAWAFRFILVDADLGRRLEEEIATAADTDGLDPMKLARLPLLDATVRETMRLQPVVPIVGRVLQQPMRLLGREFPAGTNVAPSMYLAHRRPSVYAEPARFLPDRFLTLKPSVAEWFPFGGGARRCVGAAFATYEIKMVLAAVLARAALRLATTRVRPVRRTITLTPSRGLPVIVRSRRARAAA
jgi:cytochrome P450